MQTIIDRSFDKAAIIHLRGHLRTPSTSALDQQVQALLGYGERRILVNLAEVSGLDASGVGELVAGYNKVAAASGTFRVTRPTERVRLLLVLTGLWGVLTGASMDAGGGLPPPASSPPAARSAA